MSGMREQFRMTTRILAALRLGALALAAASPSALAAQRDADTLPSVEWKAIQRAISEQRSALVAGDAAKAFGYASPGIRDQFGGPDTFFAMVRTGYAALISARYVEFLEGAVIDGTVVQPLRLIDADNTVRVALYTMERQDDGTWRIAGCIIAPSTVRAA